MDVDYSQYWICADDVAEDDSNAIEIARGLVDWQPGQAIVTVAADGSVPVDVEILAADPGHDAGDWQDVVEFSLHTDEGRLHLTPLFDGPRRPNLAGHGPGDYRLRLSATDRDPVGSRSPKERHRLQVWPAAAAGPALIKHTSQFGQTWGDEPAKRQVDWGALARTPGVRLLVDWWELVPPVGVVGTTTVEVEGVLPLSPARAFAKFDGPDPGRLSGGMQLVSASGEIDAEIAAGYGLHPHIGRLVLAGRRLESQRFRRLVYTWGFRETSYDDEPPEPRTHPIPGGSTTVEFSFSKHPAGRLVRVTHRDVPAWLDDDVTALWHLVLDLNKTDGWFAWPWTE